MEVIFGQCCMFIECAGSQMTEGGYIMRDCNCFYGQVKGNEKQKC